MGPKDKITPSLSAKIANKDTITIKRAVNVKVSVDGKELNILSAEDTVASMLASEGIALSSVDKISPDKNTKLASGMNIDIIRVENETVTEMIPISFTQTIKSNSSLPNTKRQVIRTGQNGEKQVTTRITYENGKEVARNIVSEKIIKTPVDGLIIQGTYPLMPVSRGGDVMPYRKVINVRATAYWAVNGVGRTGTASGRLAVRDPSGYSTIAVDPHIIPYGTRLFVQGYGFAVAADTGSGIVGNRIDVFFNTYREACSWAVKYVNVYILK